MSEENVVVVQAFVDTWNAGDMDAVRELLDPDVILMPVKNWPEPGPYMGGAERPSASTSESAKPSTPTR